MTKGKRPKASPRAAEAAAAKAASKPAPERRIAEDQTTDERISYSAPLHELFEQLTRQMLDRADLDEEQRQNILIAMSCPCCGAGAMSYTVKLKR